MFNDFLVYAVLFNSRTAIAGAIIGLLLVFYNSKNLNCIGALFFFKICSHIFMIFESQIGVVILVTPKQEVERKSEWFCGVNLFRSNFKVE